MGNGAFPLERKLIRRMVELMERERETWKMSKKKLLNEQKTESLRTNKLVKLNTKTRQWKRRCVHWMNPNRSGMKWTIIEVDSSQNVFSVRLSTRTFMSAAVTANNRWNKCFFFASFVRCSYSSASEFIHLFINVEEKGKVFGNGHQMVNDVY